MIRYVTNRFHLFFLDHPRHTLQWTKNKILTKNKQWNVFNFGTNTSIRMIVRNFYPRNHPMHMHGHNFQVLAEGFGDWDGTIAHAENPQRRDVQIMPPTKDTITSPVDRAVIEPGLPSYLGMFHTNGRPFYSIRKNTSGRSNKIIESYNSTRTIQACGHL